MRYFALAGCLAATLVLFALVGHNGLVLISGLICLALMIVGCLDILQTRHSLKRNDPILANLRFILEKVRPEIRQYFLESDLDGTPFNRSKRAIVYQRAKSELDATRPDADAI